jgi:tRNA pseudouridine32 synthase / 23S rRNA pseudouridine746 synthase
VTPFPVLAVSAGWLAVDKPAGVVVVPARDEDPASCLWRRLEAERGERLWVLHRLDRDTSGVLLFARSALAHRCLGMAFEHHEIAKNYLAFTRGLPPGDEGRVEQALHTARRGRMRPARPGEAGALPSATAWRVLERWSTPVGPVGLLDLRPFTGRSHQIRVHLRFLGAPLLVDPIYGGCEKLDAGAVGPADGPGLDRTPLHASSLVFPDPDTGRTVELRSNLPEDLEAFRAALRQAGSGA